MISEVGTIAALKERISRLEDVLYNVRELIDGYVDVVDGDYESGPLPNNAMRAVQIIDEVMP
jgi:hypothetical protein